MLIIKKNALPNGAHENLSGDIGYIPEGWLAVPPELEAEAQVYLPFIILTIEDSIITAVAQGEIPEPEPEPPQPPDPLEALAARMDEISAETKEMQGIFDDIYKAVVEE